jgi:hypothetical protein
MRDMACHNNFDHLKQYDDPIDSSECDTKDWSYDLYYKVFRQVEKKFFSKEVTSEEFFCSSSVSRKYLQSEEIITKVESS